MINNTLAKIFILSLLLFQAFTEAKAQYHENLMFGIRAGADFSQLSAITNTLVNDENMPLYLFNETSRFLPSVSLFTHYRFDDTQVGVEGRLSFYSLSTGINKYSLAAPVVETYNISYQYLALGLYPKVYLHRGFNVGVGVNMGACLNPSSGINYRSSAGTIAQNMHGQEQLRQVLKGRYNIKAGIIMGYEFRFGLSVEAAYYHGLTDMIETIVNPFNFTESNNKSRSVRFTIGWAISEDGFYF